jgi:hypothetical protein
VLPAETADGASFRLNTGDAPDRAEVYFIAGFAQRDGCNAVQFDVQLNAQACTSIADRENVKQFPGAVRVVQFACPLSALKDGYNEVSIRQSTDSPAQQIVWAEIRIVPSEVTAEQE